jgi:hypothetical protein
MARQERSGWRDKWYSTWHRKIRLPNGKDDCFFMDCDWCEFSFYKDKFVILAYMELKMIKPDGRFPEPTEPQWAMIKYQQELGILAFVLWYDKNKKEFFIQQDKHLPKVKFKEKEWIEKIQSLHSIENIKAQYEKQIKNKFKQDVEIIKNDVQSEISGFEWYEIADLFDRQLTLW